MWTGPLAGSVSSSRVKIALAGLLAGGLAVYIARVAPDAHLSAPEATPIVYDRAGRFLTQVGTVAGNRVEYGFWPAEAPPRLVAATLALEDRRFFSHPGIDPVGVARAAWSHLRGGRSGASTLAMQVARMQHPRPRTLWAKVLEAGTAVALTLRYGHDAVLAQYLRLAPYGANSHGIGHAARWYFDKPAADLTWAEAALLSAVPQSPTASDLRRPGGLARAAARARRALDTIDMPADERDRAREELASLSTPPAPVRPEVAMQAVLRLHSLARSAMAEPADPRLRATLDLAVQDTVARQLRTHLAGWRGVGAQQGAVMVVRRGTGEVLADAASAGWRTQGGGAIDFSATLRSPGSTLKPFLYAAALDRKLLSPAEVMQDAPESASGIGNADGLFLGPLLPRQALANSRNVPAANLLARMGLGPGLAALRSAGLTQDGGDGTRYGLGLALGAMPTRLDWLVRAYAALANDGVLTELRWFAGQPVPPPRRVVSSTAARLVTAFLSDPVARLPAFPRYGPSEYPFPVALKTGTSQQYRDSWTLAWSADYVVGVWVGRADSAPMAGLSGARGAARLAQSVLLGLHGAGRTDLSAGAFAAPAGQVAAELCTGTGRPGDCPQRLLEFAGPAAAREQPERTLAIVDPGPDAHIWRNPDAPARLQTLVLRASASPGVPQVAWLVDGQVTAVAPPDQPFRWSLTPGAHRFQLRLPFEELSSRPVRVVVE